MFSVMAYLISGESMHLLRQHPRDLRHRKSTVVRIADKRQSQDRREWFVHFAGQAVWLDLVDSIENLQHIAARECLLAG
jgi:hypothetical protein